MLRHLFLATLCLLVLCAVEHVEAAGRRRRATKTRRRRRGDTPKGRSRRRRKTATTNTPCAVCSDEYSLAVKPKFKKFIMKKKADLVKGQGVCDCASLCSQDDWYLTTLKKTKRGSVLSCKCGDGALKSVAESKTYFLGASTVENSRVLAKSAEKAKLATNAVCPSEVPAEDKQLMRLFSLTDVNAQYVWEHKGGVAHNPNSGMTSNQRSDSLENWDAIKEKYNYIRVSIIRMVDDSLVGGADNDGGFNWNGRIGAAEVESAHILFDITGTTRTNWFSRDNLVDSSFNFDQFDSKKAESGMLWQLEELCCGQTFLITSNLGDCGQSAGWFMIDAASEWVVQNWAAELLMWSDEYSEENGGLPSSGGSSNKPMVGGSCSGEACGTRKNAWANDLGEWHENEGGTFKAEVDSQATTETQCPDNEIVSQLRCKGANCERIEVYCSGPITTTEYRLLKDGWDENARWTSSFSTTDGEKFCETDEVVTGLRCEGSKCAKLSWRCRKFEKDMYADMCPWEHDINGTEWNSDDNLHKLQIIYSRSGSPENFATGNIARADNIKFIATNYRA